VFIGERLIDDAEAVAETRSMISHHKYTASSYSMLRVLSVSG
jgi:hypothetical protein